MILPAPVSESDDGIGTIQDGVATAISKNGSEPPSYSFHSDNLVDVIAFWPRRTLSGKNDLPSSVSLKSMTS